MSTFRNAARVTVASAVVLLALTGCTEKDEPAAAPPPRSVTNSAGVSEADEIALAAFRITWDQMPAADRESICWAWDELGPDWVIREFQSGMDGDFYLNAPTLRSLFSERC